jgi:hypothetical protein
MERETHKTLQGAVKVLWLISKADNLHAYNQESIVLTSGKRRIKKICTISKPYSIFVTYVNVSGLSNPSVTQDCAILEQTVLLTSTCLPPSKFHIRQL